MSACSRQCSFMGKVEGSLPDTGRWRPAAWVKGRARSLRSRQAFRSAPTPRKESESASTWFALADMHRDSRIGGIPARTSGEFHAHSVDVWSRARSESPGRAFSEAAGARRCRNLLVASDEDFRGCQEASHAESPG